MNRDSVNINSSADIQPLSYFADIKGDEILLVDENRLDKCWIKSNKFVDLGAMQ